MPSPKGPMSPLCFTCPTCRRPREVSCFTRSHEPTDPHAARVALTVACPLPGCLQPAGRACTGEIPGAGLHHPERLYRARGQVAPSFPYEVGRLVTDLVQLLKAHPEAVVDAHLDITVRERRHLPALATIAHSFEDQRVVLPKEGDAVRVFVYASVGRDRVAAEPSAEPEAEGPAGLPEGEPHLPLALPGGCQRGPLLLPPAAPADAAASRARSGEEIGRSVVQAARASGRLAEMAAQAVEEAEALASLRCEVDEEGELLILLLGELPQHLSADERAAALKGIRRELQCASKPCYSAEAGGARRSA